MWHPGLITRKTGRERERERRTEGWERNQATTAILHSETEKPGCACEGTSDPGSTESQVTSRLDRCLDMRVRKRKAQKQTQHSELSPWRTLMELVSIKSGSSEKQNKSSWCTLNSETGILFSFVFWGRGFLCRLSYSWTHSDPPEWWHYRCVPPCTARSGNFYGAEKTRNLESMCL